MSSAIDLLNECRVRLHGLGPLHIEKHRECISRECDVAVAEIRALKDAHTREHELQETCRAVRDLPNKMEYSKATKELDVVRNKAKALSLQINHAVRNHAVVLENRKRTAMELERLDEILLVAQIELSEYGEAPSLEEEADYVPLRTARERALVRLKATLSSLEEVHETSQRETAEHRDAMYDLKAEIKSTRADIQAMEAGTYAPTLEAASRLVERAKAQTGEMNARRKVVVVETEQIQTDMAKNTLVHNANISALQTKEMDLKQKLADLTKTDAASIQNLKSALEKVKEENTEHDKVLKQLESRLADEQEQARLRQQEVDKRRQLVKERKELEEKKWFAAFIIQLRWKAYLKRKAQSAKGKKKGKKGKKGKKKK